MMHVKIIELDLLIPEDRIRVVAMQPFIRLQKPVSEPYKWDPAKIDYQIAAIENTLDIAQNENGKEVNFIIFPEYSVPGIAGLLRIEERVKNQIWPKNTILFAGIHGLMKVEYIEICEKLEITPEFNNQFLHINDNEWINCSIIWVKSNTGAISHFVQLKAKPAYPELNITYRSMHMGDLIYVFKCKYKLSEFPCYITSIICFDWVSREGPDTLCNVFMQELKKANRDQPLDLDWVFVLQHNEKPNHELFLSRTHEFLIDKSIPFINRDRCAVLMINTAASEMPTSKGDHGFTACIFSPTIPFHRFAPYKPTVCLRPENLRHSGILNRCHDNVFREMGECIHDFVISVPKFTIADASDKKLPIEIASVFPVHAGMSDDLRLPGRPVAAAVKWLCDTLDYKIHLSNRDMDQCPLKDESETSETNLLNIVRKLQNENSENFVNQITSGFRNGNLYREEERKKNADIWSDEEENSVNTAINVITIFGISFQISQKDNTHNFLTNFNDEKCQIIAIQGETHLDCMRHFDEIIRPYLEYPTIVITKDAGNLQALPNEHHRITETSTTNMAVSDYQNIIQIARIAVDHNDLKNHLNGSFKFSKCIL